MEKPKFKINNKYDSPEILNYDILSLHKKRTFNVRGELNTVEYYKEYDLTTQTFSDLVVKETRVYLRNPPVTGWVYMRQMTIEWYLTDGSIGCTKVTTKYYTAEESYEEGKTRRSNVINTTSISLVGLIGEENATDFLNICDDQIDLYIKGSVQPLIDVVDTAQQEYMLAGSPSVKSIISQMLDDGR